MLEIENLTVAVGNKIILKSLSLNVKKGEIHALMGPNGAGKSTLAKVLAGHPAYQVLEGKITYKGEDLLEKEPEERSHQGIFVSFQYPVEISGVSNQAFLRLAFNSQRKALGERELSEHEFTKVLEEKMHLIKIRPEFALRNINENFSGGEKKKNEILQMAILNPSLALLDETDSGLDIDALRIVSEGVNELFNPEMGIILVTHYQRLLNHIKPHYVHVLMNGKIVESGNAELALLLEKRGYDWLMSSNEVVT